MYTDIMHERFHQHLDHLNNGVEDRPEIETSEKVMPDPEVTPEVQANPELPQTFEQAVSYLREKNHALIELQAREMGCYYHGVEHTKDVERRATAIIRAIAKADGRTDTAHLLAVTSLAASGHDVEQVFEARTLLGNPRSRKAGVSEGASMLMLIHQIDELNHKVGKVLVGEEDIETVAEALDCTIASFTKEEGIFQRELSPNSGIVARAIALADLGGLGMDGYYQFQEEAARVFLEENLDLFDAVWDGGRNVIDTSQLKSEEREVFHTRLLRWCSFNIQFAKGREARFEQELTGLSPEALEAVRELFSGFSDTVAEAVEQEQLRQGMDLDELLTSYQFEEYLPEFR
jgi:hypothetical protein